MALPGYLAKRAITAAARNPQKAKKAVVAILTTLVILLFLPAIMLQTIASLFGDKEINTELNIAETEVYQSVYPIYQEYLEAVNQKMEEQAAEIREANTETDEDGNEICTVEVSITLNQDNLATLFSYLTLKDPSIQEAKKYKADKDEINQFYDRVCSIKIEQPGEDAYYIYNTFLTAGEIADIYFSDESDHELYLVSYENFKDFLDQVMESGSGQSGGSINGEYSGDLVYAANGMEIPLYRQWEEPWGSAPYGSSTIKACGCAPTSIAMVATYLTGKTVTPDQITAWTGNRYYVEDVGSSWSIFGACAGHWGMNCTNLGKDINLMVNSLQDGHPVIASMGPGTFTKGGHFIVLRGITEDGKILVNDPADNASKDHINQAFHLDLIARESKNFWRFQ